MYKKAYLGLHCKQGQSQHGHLNNSRHSVLF